MILYRCQQRYHRLASLTTPIHVTTPTSSQSNRRNGSAGSTRRRISDSFTTHPPLVTSPTSHSPTVTRVTPSHPPSTTVEPHPPLESIGTDWGLTYSPVLIHKGSGTGVGSIGMEWDGDSDNSENVFPETSLNMADNDTSYHSEAFTEVTTLSVGVKREKPLSLRPARGRSYSAVIPGQEPRRQSGCGHGTFRSSTGSGWSQPWVGGGMTGSPLRHRTTCESVVTHDLIPHTLI